MKRIVLMLVLFVAAKAGFAQQKPWPEMKDFHSIMSKTFHPSEDNNLQPLRDSASILVAKAKSWQSSTVPAGYKADVTKPILAKLVKQCEDINVAVAKNKSDADLKEMISKAHDTFHEIMEKCREGSH